MSLLKKFESNMANILEGSPHSMGSLPISFNKLAKRAFNEIKAASYSQDNSKIAPSLITYLVSGKDNALMASVYIELKQELEAYLYEEAKQKGYTMIDKPLVRFVLDGSLKQGRFDVIVEDVPQVIMAHLRREEDAFLHGRPIPKPNLVQRKKTALVPSDSLSLSLPLKPLDSQLLDYAINKDEVDAHPFINDHQNIDDPFENNEFEFQDLAEDETAYAFEDSILLDEEIFTPDALGEIQIATIPQFYLINRKTLESHHLIAPKVSIGRDDKRVDIAIADPNISRVHAYIIERAGSWIIIDNDSTNSTFVNGQEIKERTLQSGDHIVLGITEFEFRED